MPTAWTAHTSGNCHCRTVHVQVLEHPGLLNSWNPSSDKNGTKFSSRKSSSCAPPYKSSQAELSGVHCGKHDPVSVIRYKINLKSAISVSAFILFHCEQNIG